MKTVNVTMEKIIRTSKTLTITDEEYEDIISDGICPRWEDMEKYIEDVEKEYLETKSLRNGDVEFDYCISDDEGRELVEWG